MTLLLSGSPGRRSTRTSVRFARRELPASFAVIIGGRPGRARDVAPSDRGRHRAQDHRARQRSRHRTGRCYVIGDATDPDILESAGIDRAASVAITTHDDDVNVYLTLYCRSMRSDVQILSRATLEQNVSTLHRAGADFVLSYVPMEATAIFDIVRRGNLLLLAEGLEVFTVPVPAPLVGKAICGVPVARGHGLQRVRGAPSRRRRRASRTSRRRSKPDTELILIGDRDDERRFFERYGSRRPAGFRPAGLGSRTILPLRPGNWEDPAVGLLKNSHTERLHAARSSALRAIPAGV